MSCSINEGRAHLELPQGYREMTPEEVEGLLVQKKTAGHTKTWTAWGAVSDEPAVKLFANALKQPALRGRLAGMARMRDREAEGTQRVTPEFNLLAKTQRTVGEQEAYGFRYSYVRDGGTRIAEHLLACVGGYYYMFIVVSAAADAPAALDAFEDLLASVEFGA